jgi:hypothetical protein
MLKMQCRCSVFWRTGKDNDGACFRNSFGEFIVGLTQWQQAMNEAKHRGFERVQFESDSQVLVEAISRKRQGNLVFLSIVNDIILIMLSWQTLKLSLLGDK